MKKRILEILKYILFLGIGVGLLYIVVKDLQYEVIISHFKKANYFWAFLMVPVAIISHWLRAIRWNMLIHKLGYQPNTTTTFYAVMIGYLANTAVPRLGEITRCGVLSKKNNIPLNALIGTVIAERVFDTFCLAIIILLTISLQLSLLGDFVKQTLIVPLQAKFSVAQLVELGLLVVLVGIAGFFVIKFFLKKYKHLVWVERINNMLKGFWEGLLTIKSLDHPIRFMLLTICIWVLYVLMIYCCFFAVAETNHLNLLDALTIMALGSIGIVAPVPAGIGTYHAVIIFVLMEIYHLAAEPATTFAFISHTTQLLMMLVVGFFSLFMIVYTKKESQNKQ